MLVIIIIGLTFIIEWFDFSPSHLKFVGTIIFVVPTFIVLRCLSTLWFADVANAALRYRGLSGGKLPIFSRAASDFLHTIIVELIFLGQVMAIYAINIAIVSSFFGFIYMSLLNSLYSFDYIWMARGLTMTSRLSFIERRWPFHLGFGTLLTFATSISESFVINGLIFGALFPFFIVSSFLANSTKATSDLSTNISPMPFYSVALTITNKISLAVFGKLC